MTPTVSSSGSSPRAVHARRVRCGALALAAAGVLFFLYPVIRPYPDSAAAMASAAWVVSHLFAVLGFVLLTIGVGALWMALAQTRGERLAFRALMTTGFGVGLTLPYYGAEVFGLHAIGQRSLQDHNRALLDLPDAIRFSPAAAGTFVAGLLLLAAGPTLAAVAVRRSGVLPQICGVPMALGFVLFLPQFFGPPSLRIAHGLLVGFGCIWLAVEMWRGWRTLAARSPSPGPAGAG